MVDYGSGVLPFDPIKSYSNSPTTLGQPFWVENFLGRGYGVWLVMLKNLGATAIAAGQLATALTTDRNTGGCRLSGTAGAQLQVAGVRPIGADSVAQNEYGAFICGGPAEGVQVSGTDVSAAEMAVISGTTAGGVQAYSGANTDAGTVYAALLKSQAIFAFSQAASAAAVATINIIRSVYK